MPLSGVALEDSQQVERGIEVVKGDRGIGLVSGLLHKPLHLGMQSLCTGLHLVAVVSSPAQMVPGGGQGKVGQKVAPHFALPQTARAALSPTA